MKIHYNSWALDKQKVSEYKQEIPHSLLQVNPRHREEEQQNTYSHKASGRQLKQSNYHFCSRQCVNKNRKSTNEMHNKTKTNTELPQIFLQLNNESTTM